LWSHHQISGHCRTRMSALPMPTFVALWLPRTASEAQSGGCGMHSRQKRLHRAAHDLSSLSVCGALSRLYNYAKCRVMHRTGSLRRLPCEGLRRLMVSTIKLSSLAIPFPVSVSGPRLSSELSGRLSTCWQSLKREAPRPGKQSFTLVVQNCPTELFADLAVKDWEDQIVFQ